ncbi:MAG: RluA family pseudouridine synthase [Defluviitaleaceae bacterium]|nr:RluA family pseudouridine synthase [Defluviitaleaceae bacterium]
MKKGDKIWLVFPDEKSWIEPENIPLDVLFEDDDILVLNKQPGIVVHPTKGHRDGTVAGAVVYHMKQRGESYKPRFISRLDMDTSGVLLIGKNSHAQNNLAKQAASGGVGKYYTAVLEGRLEDDLPRSGIIDLPIGLEKPDEPRRIVLCENDGGYPSQTEYEVLGYNGNGSALTIVRARLITGRTHQIRVHFAYYGHPVLGDHLYGNRTTLISRQALHATEIVFAHPAAGRFLRIEAPMPKDMTGLLRVCGSSS